MPIKRIQQTVPLRILDWQRCVGLFLEGFSLLCELHGAQVPEGRVEPLVVVPPHVPVDVRAQLLHVRVDVPVDELLPDEPVGGFDHRAVVRVARPGKGTRDAEHVEHAFDAFPGEPAAAIRVEHLDLIQREAQRGERGQHECVLSSWSRPFRRWPVLLVVGYCIGYCMRAWVLRQDSPSKRIIRPWWTVRSMIAAAMLGSPKILPHPLNSMLVV